MIMGKRQIVLAALILVLGVAIYLNWQFSGEKSQFNELTEQTNGEVSSRNYGEPQLANGEIDDANTVKTDSEDVFNQTKLNRKKSREESLETIKQVIAAVDGSDEDKKAALLNAERQTKATEAEMKMETLIKSKGFSDCVVFINDSKVSAIIKTEGLNEDQATQIRDIIIEQTKVAAENISINEVK